MIEISVGISLGALALLTLGGVLYWRHKRKLRDLELSKRPRKHTAEEVVEDNEVPLGSSIYVGSDSYVVDARDKHSLVDDDMNPDPDEYWWCLTLREPMEGAIMHLTCEQDDEDRWEFWLMEDVTEKVRQLDAFEGVGFHGDDGAPPEEFEFQGLVWRAVEDEYDYTVHVRSERADRRKPSEYITQVAEYQSFTTDGTKGTRVMSVELWDGGCSISVGKQYHGTVLLFPEDETAAAS